MSRARVYHVTQHPARRTRATANRATRVMSARADDAVSRTATSLGGAPGLRDTCATVRRNSCKGLAGQEGARHGTAR